MDDGISLSGELMSGASPNFQDKLHSLLEEAEMFVPGSNERTNSLEQIRSIMLDNKGKKQPNSGRARGSGGSAGANFLHNGLSPGEDGMLDELYHEAGDGEHYDDMDTFQMDDVAEPTPAPTFPHVQARAHPITSSQSHKNATAAGGQTQNHSAPTTAARILGSGAPRSAAAAAAGGSTAAGVLSQDGGFAAVAAGGAGAASVLSGGVGGGKASSAAAAAARPPVARPAAAAKSSLQMSNLAREEQAAIPHVPAGDTDGAPVVPMQLEPEKRLSHKEVEQRRREKAKQYFDELRGLLPYGGDSAKFDKNAILQHSIALIKQLLTELDTEQAHLGKTNEEELAKTLPGSSEFRCCFDVTRQPLCFAGPEGRIWEANAAFCTLLGYTRLEIGGLSILTATAPSDTETSQQAWSSMLNSSQTQASYQCKLLRKDSQQVACNIDLSLFKKNNKAHCFLVAANPSL